MRHAILFMFLLLCGFSTLAQTTSDTNSRQSLFQYIYSQPERVHITITTDARHLLRTSAKKEYQPASMKINIQGADQLELIGDIKARGMMRKKVCRIPPAKFNFDKDEIDSLGFSRLDKLKFVFPCNDNAFNQDKLYKEYFLYGLYNLIDTNGMQAALVDVTMEYEGEEKFDFVGFVVEDEDNYAARKNGVIIEGGKLGAAGLNRTSFVNMEFFQYMIANTDWSIRNRHNLEMVKLKSMDRAIAVPYDFDYAGFVGQSYAVPHVSLPIKSVHDRYWFSYPLTDKEFYRGLNYFKAIEDKLLAHCEQASSYMEESSIKENKAYLESFFELLEKPKVLRSLTKK